MNGDPPGWIYDPKATWDYETAMGQLVAAHQKVAAAEPSSKSTTFNVIEVENGYIVTAGGKQHIARDHDELLDVITKVLVVEKITR